MSSRRPPTQCRSRASHLGGRGEAADDVMACAAASGEGRAVYRLLLEAGVDLIGTKHLLAAQRVPYLGRRFAQVGRTTPQIVKPAQASRGDLIHSLPASIYATPIVLCALLLGVSIACDRPGPSTKGVGTQPIDTSVTTAPPVASSPVSLRGVERTIGPRETLVAYLAGSVFRGAAAVPDSLHWCPDPGPDRETDEGWEPDKYIAIAQPRVLGIRGSGEETGGQQHEVVAEVIQLAEVTRGDSGGWVAQIDVIPDTLVWTVQRRPSGTWAVCGPAWRASTESPSGTPLFLVTEEFARRGEINSARWLSAGASWDALARLADSLRSMRGL